MKSTLKTRLILLAAVAALPIAALPASAQYESTQQGDALDANRRVGDDWRNNTRSGYRIDTRLRALDRPTGNQIVTGNVTGNRGFRDGVGYRDAREFTGPTSSRRSDNFIRESVGVLEGSRRMTDYNVSVPFYPAGRTIDPPPGYTQRNPYGGGYLPSTAIDTRIDRGVAAPRVGSQLVLPGPLDATTGDASIITASPLLGVQRAPFDPYAQPYAGARTGLLDDATIQRMRMELRPGLTPEDAQPTDTEAPAGVDGQTGASGDVTAQRLGAGNVVGGAVGGSEAQSTRQRLLPGAGEQTPIYAELRRKLDELAGDRNLTDEEAFRAAQRARKEATEAAEAAKKAQTPAPGAQPATPATPTTPVPPAQPDGTTPPSPPAPGTPPGGTPQAPSDPERLGLTDFSKRNEQLLADAAKSAQPARRSR